MMLSELKCERYIPKAPRGVLRGSGKKNKKCLQLSFLHADLTETGCVRYNYSSPIDLELSEGEGEQEVKAEEDGVGGGRQGGEG